MAMLAMRILTVPSPHPLRVGIDGVDASGKTTLADELAAAVRIVSTRQIIRATIDRFHNPREIRYRRGPDSPEGYYQDSFDLATLRQCLLDPLGINGTGGNRAIQTGRFDFRGNAPVESDIIQAAPDAVLLFDGIFLLRPELEDCWDFSIFVQVGFETVLARAVERDRELLGDAQAVIDRYTKRYIPAQQYYLETCRPQERVDVVIGNDDVENPEIIL